MYTQLTLSTLDWFVFCLLLLPTHYRRWLALFPGPVGQWSGLLGGTRGLKAPLTLTCTLPAADRQQVVPISCCQQRAAAVIHLRPKTPSQASRGRVITTLLRRLRRQLVQNSLSILFLSVILRLTIKTIFVPYWWVFHISDSKHQQIFAPVLAVDKENPNERH